MRFNIWRWARHDRIITADIFHRFVWMTIQILALAFSPNVTDNLIQAKFIGSNSQRVKLSLLIHVRLAKPLFFLSNSNMSLEKHKANHLAVII